MGIPRAFLIVVLIVTASTLLLLLLPRGRDISKPSLTLVTALKSWNAADNNTQCSPESIQLATLQNWLSFAAVLVLADNPDVCITVKQLGLGSQVTCIQHSCMNRQYGRPEISCLLRRGVDLARTRVVMFSNPDMVYLGVTAVVESALASVTNFLLVGRRTNVDAAVLCASMKEPGTLPGIQGTPAPDHFLDYFIFGRRSLPLESMPPFLIGVWRWDNWLLHETIVRNESLVVDASLAIQAYHYGSSSAQDTRIGAGYNDELFAAWFPNRTPLPTQEGFGHLSFARHASSLGENGSVLIHLRTS